MGQEKDIRFTEKKVDESWKEQASASKAAAAERQTKTAETSKIFLGLIQSLGLQAMMHLGAIPNPVSNATEVNLEAAKEAIDILITLRDKTNANLSTDEEKFLNGLLSELQVKFSQSV